MSRISERGLFFIVGLTLVFLLLNFNWNLGTAYLFFLLFSFILVMTDKKVSIRLERRTDNRSMALVVGVAAYLIFLVAAQTIIGAIIGQAFTLQEMARLYAEATTPAFAGSVTLTFLSWGILVPLIETKTFFGRIYEEICDAFKSNPYTISAVTITGVAIVVALFTIFHATSFGVKNNAGLMAAALFAIFSMILVFVYKELKQAVIFHIAANVNGLSQKMFVESV